MRIGIDFRLDETGIGRYTEELITHLAKVDQENEYLIFVRLDRFNSWKVPGKNFTKVFADAPRYSFAEQLKMPGILRAQRLDLMHFPHFNVPVLYPGKFVVTIHDLTHTKYSTAASTTLGRAKFTYRKLGYGIAMRTAVRRSRKIIAISKHDKQDIVDILHANPSKVEVIYEGFNPQIFGKEDHRTLKNHGIVEPYFLAVGNFYPHKNLPRLVEAFATAKQKGLDGQLVLAGDYVNFDSTVRKAAAANHVESDVILTGRVSDAQLGALYKRARGLAFVSLAEGFGLPPLEAFANTIPVLASDASSIPEVVGNGALLVDPEKTEAIAAGLLRLASDAKLRASLTKAGTAQLSKYSWEKAARETLAVYQKAA
jgi:glycosyltransferase involved in cell wall biosynthesis